MIVPGKPVFGNSPRRSPIRRRAIRTSEEESDREGYPHSTLLHSPLGYVISSHDQDLNNFLESMGIQEKETDLVWQGVRVHGYKISEDELESLKEEYPPSRKMQVVEVPRERVRSPFYHDYNDQLITLSGEVTPHKHQLEKLGATFTPVTYRGMKTLSAVLSHTKDNFNKVEHFMNQNMFT